MDPEPTIPPAFSAPPSVTGAGRRRVLRRIGLAAGPTVVTGLLIATAVSMTYASNAQRSNPGGCDRRDDTEEQIEREPVFDRPPRSASLGMALASVSCNPSPDNGTITFITNGTVSRSLDTSMSRADVAKYYADLAERSGWRSDRSPAGLYSATKPASVGGCPWWFVVSAGKNGYGLHIYYQPLGVPTDDCAWASDDKPMLIPLAN